MNAETVSSSGLDMPHSGSSAEQAREMGIALGDTIEGKEHYHDGTWTDARLQLAWIGETVAVWLVWRRSSSTPEWRYTGEQANWTLDGRRWVRHISRLTEPETGK